MRSRRFRYSILIFLGLVAIILYACSSGASDPPVTPDTTIPSTLHVTVTIVEDQDASDGANGMSVITLGFSTNEIAETNTVIFTHGEWISCNGSRMTLGNATSYWFRVAIPYDSLYTCNYYYPQLGTATPINIFSVHAARMPLHPILVRPVPNTSVISVIYASDQSINYTSDHTTANSSSCTVQVTANASNGNATGNRMSQNGRYSGLDVSSLNGAGNISMTRTCDWNRRHGNIGDNGQHFDQVNVTYKSTATFEITWVPPDSPTQGTNS
jgi:hypothetical protein